MSTDGIPPVLTIQYRGFAGSPQVYRLISGTTLVAVGGPLPGVTYETQADNEVFPNARVIRFEDTLIAVHSDKIFMLDEGSDPTTGDDDWVVVHTISDINTIKNYGKKTGVYELNVNGVQTLIMGYLNTGTKIGMVTSTDGITWVESGDLATFTLASSLTTGRSIVFQNKIFWVYGAVASSAAAFVEINPQTPIAIKHDITSWLANSNVADLCVFDDRLWTIGWDSTTASGRCGLYELAGVTWTKSFDIEDGASNPNNDGGHDVRSGIAMFTNGINMYAMIPGRESTNVGNMSFKFSLTAGSGSSLSQADISAAVLPTTLRPPADGPTVNSFRWWVFQDNDTHPDVPRIHLWVQNSDVLATGTSSYYRWNGDTTLIGTPPGTGGIGPGAGLSWPGTKSGGGERVWSSGKINIKIKDVLEARNGQVVRFEAWSDDLTLTYKVRFKYDEKEEIAELSATLRGGSSDNNTTVMSDSAGDYVSGVVADGVTLYSVIWETATDQVAQFQNVLLMPTIEIE